MKREYFGTDGVRGRVGEHPITPQFVMHLGYAAGRVLASAEHTHDSELLFWADKWKVPRGRLPARASVAADASHPAFEVNLDACIQCTRCIRACRDIQVNDVLGLALRGAHAKIVFDQDDAVVASTVRPATWNDAIDV